MAERARITIRTESDDQSVSLSGDVLTVGRAPECDIVVASPLISRLHGRFVYDGNAYRYVQIGRTNPTLLGGSVVEDTVLSDGDVLQIGNQTGAVSIEYHAEPNVESDIDMTFVGTIALPERTSAVSIGRAPENTLVLDDPAVSRHHAELVLGSRTARLHDLGSTNGSYVNGEPVTDVELRVGDVVRIGSHRLVFDGTQLRTYDDGASVTLEADDLCQDVGNVRILSHVSFTALPGKVTAIAGASGAGKSTLLEALNGIRPASAGRVLINGSDFYANQDSLRSLIGYVPQSEILHRELPLGRALLHSARLRLPEDTSRQEIDERVTRTLEELELADRRDLAIRVLSGGQQKRASIAVELLTRPGLFFLDEPTSGLDPGLSAKFMELLLRLASEGRTVILVSHDPEALAMSHELVFLAPGGVPAYIGPTDGALSHFGAKSFSSIYAKVEEAPQPQHSPVAVDRLGSADGLRVPSRASARPTQAPARPSGLHQLRVLVGRYAEIMMRDTRNLSLLVLQAPIIGLFLLLVSRANSLTLVNTPTSDAKKVLLLLAISAIWLGTINSSRELVKEIPIFRRERMAGVGVLPYVLSKLVVLGGLCLIQSLLLLLTLGIKVKLPPEGPLMAGPVEMYVTLCLASLAAMAMGLVLSAATTTQERAVGLVPLVLVPQVIFAGVIFSLGGVSRAISWLCVSKWSVQLLGTTAQLPGAEFNYDAGFLIARWLLLGTMTCAFVLATLWLTARHD